MPDREKVIKALEGCDLWIGAESECDGDRECPYANVEKGNVPCVNGLIKDALALLKEQEQAMKEKDGTISNLIAQIKEISQCYERVVRCKDCFYGEVEPDDNSYFFCTHPLHKLESHESHYCCADGEKKVG